MKTLKVGLLGAGGIAKQHGQAWRANAPRGEIVAVADISAPRAQDFVDRYTEGGARVYDGIDALVADADVDAVDICLPHHLHADAIIKAAGAGKAILCEKPLCTSLEDAAEISAALKESGATFMSAHNQLFQPSLLEARRLLASGALGRRYLVRSIEAFQHRGLAAGQQPTELAEGESPWAWRADPSRMGGGEVLDTGWHASYRLLALADDRSVEVSALMDRFFVQDMPAEDTGVLLVRFASGTIGEIITTWAFGTVENWHFEVAAEQGSLAGSGSRLVHQLHGWPQPVERTNQATHTFTAQVTHFLDVIQHGVPSQATFEHAARVLQLTKAAYRAAAEHRAMALPEDPLQPGQPAEAGAQQMASAAS